MGEADEVPMKVVLLVLVPNDVPSLSLTEGDEKDGRVFVSVALLTNGSLYRRCLCRVSGMVTFLLFSVGGLLFLGD